jgi:hypothetical protein
LGGVRLIDGYQLTSNVLLSPGSPKRQNIKMISTDILGRDRQNAPDTKKLLFLVAETPAAL